jgi:hypothetical protein
MSASGEFSVFSRFLVKFVEIIAAGLATAVSGYLIAHLSGAFSSPVPLPARAVIEDAPNAVPPAPPPSSIFGDRDDQHAGPKQEVTASPVPQPAPPVNTAKTAPPHKHAETATTAADSLAARVRAALATIDANRTGQLAVPPQGEVRLNPTSAAPPQAQPSADSSRSAVTGTAVRTAVQPGSVPAQQTQPNPLVTVEVPSQPVAAVQPPAAPSAEKETGVFSGLEQMLRHDPLVGSEDAPRPPMPVGQ